MRNKWIKYNTNGVRNDHMYEVKVPGVSITGYVSEVVGDYIEWDVIHGMAGQKEITMQGTAKTLDAAKAEAEAAIERLVDQTIRGLQKWKTLRRRDEAYK